MSSISASAAPSLSACGNAPITNGYYGTTSSKSLFLATKRRLIQLQCPIDSLRAVLDIWLEDRTALLAHTKKQRIDRPLIVCTPYYKFNTNVDDAIRTHWKGIYDDPWLPYYLPTPLFLAYSNHKMLGNILKETFRQHTPHLFAPEATFCQPLRWHTTFASQPALEAVYNFCQPLRQHTTFASLPAIKQGILSRLL